MAGRRYCPFEGEYVPLAEIRSYGGTLVHDVDPPHRLTDGMTVTVANGTVVVESSAAVEAMADAMPDEMR
jgi:hypothetical protein